MEILLYLFVTFTSAVLTMFFLIEGETFFDKLLYYVFGSVFVFLTIIYPLYTLFVK